MVENHLSYRSNDGLPKLFQRMFRMDPVAAKYTMMKDKSRLLLMVFLLFFKRCLISVTLHGLEWALTRASTRNSRNVKWTPMFVFGMTRKILLNQLTWHGDHYCAPMHPIKERNYSHLDQLERIKTFILQWMDQPRIGERSGSSWWSVGWKRVH